MVTVIMKGFIPERQPIFLVLSSLLFLSLFSTPQGYAQDPFGSLLYDGEMAERDVAIEYRYTQPANIEMSSGRMTPLVTDGDTLVNNGDVAEEIRPAIEHALNAFAFERVMPLHQLSDVEGLEGATVTFGAQREILFEIMTHPNHVVDANFHLVSVAAFVDGETKPTATFALRIRAVSPELEGLTARRQRYHIADAALRVAIIREQNNALSRLARNIHDLGLQLEPFLPPVLAISTTRTARSQFFAVELLDDPWSRFPNALPLMHRATARQLAMLMREHQARQDAWSEHQTGLPPNPPNAREYINESSDLVVASNAEALGFEDRQPHTMVEVVEQALRAIIRLEPDSSRALGLVNMDPRAIRVLVEPSDQGAELRTVGVTLFGVADPDEILGQLELDGLLTRAPEPLPVQMARFEVDRLTQLDLLAPLSHAVTANGEFAQNWVRRVLADNGVRFLNDDVEMREAAAHVDLALLDYGLMRAIISGEITVLPETAVEVVTALRRLLLDAQGAQFNGSSDRVRRDARVLARSATLDAPLAAMVDGSAFYDDFRAEVRRLQGLVTSQVTPIPLEHVEALEAAVAMLPAPQTLEEDRQVSALARVAESARREFEREQNEEGPGKLASTPAPSTARRLGAISLGASSEEGLRSVLLMPRPRGSDSIRRVDPSMASLALTSAWGTLAPSLAVRSYAQEAIRRLPEARIR